MAFWRQQFLQGLQRSYPTGGVLFAVAATETDAADDFIIHDDGKAAELESTGILAIIT